MKVTAVFAAIAFLMLCQTGAVPAGATPAAQQVTLDNGLELVVIVDKRAPIVTHMVWYRVGRADEPPGQSGLAHFVEHLMFKATPTHEAGAFQRVVGRLGGSDNALTGQDSTVYYQRMAKQHLATAMRFEADRMQNLRPTEEDMVVEREIVLAERRQRIDQSPLDALNEEMSAALFRNHPYGTPVLGWPAEISALTLTDAMDFYRRHYTPSNVLVVVAGDVDPQDVRRLAEATYGAIPPRPTPDRVRPVEPDQRAARRVVLADPRVAGPSVVRSYLAISPARATGNEAETIEVLVRILCQDEASRLHRALVSDQRIATAVSGGYQSRFRDHGQIACFVNAASGTEPAKIETAIDAVLAAVLEAGVTDAEVDYARWVIETRHLFEMDRQFNIANRYGAALSNRQSVADVDGYLDRLRRVSPAEVRAMALKSLLPRASVTGWLVPEPTVAAARPEPRR